MNILIIGGDSKLSRYLESNLIIDNISFLKTSRRIDSRSLFLNFENIEDFSIPKNLTHAIIVGGVTSYDDCDANYEYAYNINCINIPKLIEKLLKKNIFVVYISTNTVFKYDYLPNENDRPNPAFPYANLKLISEKKIHEIASQTKAIKKLAIIRLTKNVCENTPPFNNWIKLINNNEKFTAFKDLYFAPITFHDSSKTIIKIIINNNYGIFHLSGERDMSYYEFGLGFTKHLNEKNNLCDGVFSHQICVKLKYNHPVTALGMNLTSEKLKIKPINVINVYNYLSKYIK